MKPRYCPPFQRKPLRLGMKSVGPGARTSLPEPSEWNQEQFDALYQKLVSPGKKETRTLPLIGTHEAFIQLGYQHDQLIWNEDCQFWQTNDGPLYTSQP